VILDASWTDRHLRERAASVASATATDLVELRCVAPRAVAAERIRGRRGTGKDPSEATEEIALRMAEHADPWPSARVLDASLAPHQVLESALQEVL
jgi:predicted kinase